MNPNNPKFYKARGLRERPCDWPANVAQRRERGLREHAVNLAVAEAPEKRAAHGRDTEKVGHAVRSAFGGQAQVLKGGARAKHVHLADSDVDLKVVLPGGRPMRSEDRDILTGKLAKQFGADRVETSNPNIHIVHGEGGSMDLVPCCATFFPDGFHAGLPRNDGFKKNPQARLAVRDRKLRAKEHGLKVRGHDVEEAVRRAQQGHPRAGFDELNAGHLIP